MEFNDLPVNEKYQHLVGVLKTMQSYNRENGWMRWDGDKLRFYDGEVEDGVYMEIGWLKFWVAAFK
jgi:hypothetical protein